MSAAGGAPVDVGGVHSGLRAPVFSCQILPPALSDGDRERFLEEGRSLAKLGVKLVFLPDSPRGGSRASPIVAAWHLEQECGLRCIPHLNSRDRNQIAIEGLLGAARLAGTRGIKVVSGMPLSASKSEVVYELDSCEMVELVHDLEIDRELTVIVGFTLGDGSDSSDLRMRRKVDAGAQYVLTTPTLDLAVIEDFLDRHPGEESRMILGLSPVPSIELLDRFRENLPIFGVPESYRRRLAAAEDEQGRTAVAVDAVLEMIDRLRPRGVAGFHIVPAMGRVAGAMALLKALARRGAFDGGQSEGGKRP